MKKSNKKSQTNKKIKDKIEDMSCKEKNKWERPKRERMFMNQDKKKREFTEFKDRRTRFHRHHEERIAAHHIDTQSRSKHRSYRFHRLNEERLAPSYMHANHRGKHRPCDREMQIHGSMRPHRRPIRGHFSNLKTIAGRDMRYRFHREDRHRRDWHLRGYRPRHDWRADKKMEKLLCEKQRLERRLVRMRRRLHFVNHQLYAQV